jgi:hypothetical protein
VPGWRGTGVRIRDNSPNQDFLLPERRDSVCQSHARNFRKLLGKFFQKTTIGQLHDSFSNRSKNKNSKHICVALLRTHPKTANFQSQRSHQARATRRGLACCVDRCLAVPRMRVRRVRALLVLMWSFRIGKLIK